MKRILLDGGSHFGKGLRKMDAIYGLKTFDQIYTWEANPHTHKRFLNNERFFNLPVTSYHAALSDHDGEISLNIETVIDRKTNGESKTGLGTSVISLDQWRAKGNFNDTENVPCIDFGKWIIDNCNKEDFIVVKMDIEGAEYDVLEGVVNTGAIDYVNELHIEWHSRMFANPEEQKVREDRLLKILEEKGIPVKNC